MNSNDQKKLETKSGSRRHVDGGAVVIEIRKDAHRLEGNRQLEPTLLKKELKAARAEVGALSANLLIAQEEERRRIARELHDDLSQRTAVIEFELDQVAHFVHGSDGTAALSVARRHLAELAKAIREISHQLHPSIITDLGLSAALKQLVNEFNESGGFATLTLNDRLGVAMFDPVVGTAFYRIAQEALRNVRKHAGAVPVRVRLGIGASDIYLSVQDSGPGFVVETFRNQGLGLLGMRERARLIGARFMVRSRPGDGTLIAIRVPTARCTSPREARVKCGSATIY